MVTVFVICRKGQNVSKSTKTGQIKKIELRVDKQPKNATNSVLISQFNLFDFETTCQIQQKLLKEYDYKDYL